MPAHPRTPGEIEAQRAKRHRRYATSVGKGFCQLYRAGRMCQDESVRRIGEVYICQHHSDLLDGIKRDAKGKRRHITTRITPRRTAA
jgi:hypothetical protein